MKRTLPGACKTTAGLLFVLLGLWILQGDGDLQNRSPFSESNHPGQREQFQPPMLEGPAVQPIALKSTPRLAPMNQECREKCWENITKCLQVGPLSRDSCFEKHRVCMLMCDNEYHK